MEESLAADQLAAAARYEQLARRNSRWYVGYLVLFGVASFGICAVMSTDPYLEIGLALYALWVIFIFALSRWARTQPVEIRGHKKLHYGLCAGWTVIYVVTSILGWWWVGAVATAAFLFLGALIAYLRSAR